MFNSPYKSTPPTCSWRGFAEVWGVLGLVLWCVLCFDIWLQSWSRIGLGRVGGSDSSFRWKRMREASQVSKQNPGKHNDTRQQSQYNNARPEVQKQNYRTSGAKFMSFWIFFSLELFQFLLWTNGKGLKSKTNGEMLNFRHCFCADFPFVARGKMFRCLSNVQNRSDTSPLRETCGN